MTEEDKHWLKDHKEYWGGFLLVVMAQAWLSAAQTLWQKVEAFALSFGAYFILNLIVAVIILLLTWPVRKNFSFSRFIKILVAFSTVYFLSQLIVFLLPYFQG